MTKKAPAVPASEIATLPQSEVGALALITLNPETYVAEVFKPFRTKLDALKEEVALIHFKDDRLYDAPHKYVDISTVAGMDIAIKYRAAFRDDVRIAAEKTRVQRKAPMLAIGKLLDSEYKAIESDAAPFESHFDSAIRDENSRKEAIKAAKELAEAERVAAIRAKVAEISSLPAKHARATSAQLTDALRELATREIMKEEFAEQTDDARAAVDNVAAELIALRDAATASEAAALAAEEARKAEAARIEQERATLAAQRAENERIANEQAIESQRLANLAAAQEAEATRIHEQAATNLKAEQDALAEQVRIQREAAAEQQRKLDEQAAQIAADRAALARMQEEAAERAIKAAQLEADHAEALIDNATFDDAMTRLAAVDTPTFHVAPSDDLARCTATAQAMLTNGRSLVQADAEAMQFSVAAYEDAGLDESELTDDDITEWGAECGLDKPALIVRLRKYIADSEVIA